MVSCKVTNQKFKMLYFQNKRRHGTGNLKKYLFLRHFQLPIDKNLEHLAILILGFNDITVKTIYRQKYDINKYDTKKVLNFWKKSIKQESKYTNVHLWNSIFEKKSAL